MTSICLSQLVLTSAKHLLNRSCSHTHFSPRHIFSLSLLIAIIQSLAFTPLGWVFIRERNQNIPVSIELVVHTHHLTRKRQRGLSPPPHTHNKTSDKNLALIEPNIISFKTKV